MYQYMCTFVGVDPGRDGPWAALGGMSNVAIDRHRKSRIGKLFFVRIIYSSVLLFTREILLVLGTISSKIRLIPN